MLEFGLKTPSYQDLEELQRTKAALRAFSALIDSDKELHANFTVDLVSVLKSCVD